MNGWTWVWSDGEGAMRTGRRQFRWLGRWAAGVAAVVVAGAATGAPPEADERAAVRLAAPEQMPSGLDALIVVRDAAAQRRSFRGRALAGVLEDLGQLTQTDAAWNELARSLNLDGGAAFDELLGDQAALLLTGLHAPAARVDWVVASRVDPDMRERLGAHLKPAARGAQRGQTLLTVENGAYELAVAAPLRAAAKDLSPINSGPFSVAAQSGGAAGPTGAAERATLLVAPQRAGKLFDRVLAAATAQPDREDDLARFLTRVATTPAEAIAVVRGAPCPDGTAAQATVLVAAAAPEGWNVRFVAPAGNAAPEARQKLATDAVTGAPERLQLEALDLLRIRGTLSATGVSADDQALLDQVLGPMAGVTRQMLGGRFDLRIREGQMAVPPNAGDANALLQFVAQNAEAARVLELTLAVEVGDIDTATTFVDQTLAALLRVPEEMRQPKPRPGRGSDAARQAVKVIELGAPAEIPPAAPAAPPQRGATLYWASVVSDVDADRPTGGDAEGGPRRGWLVWHVRQRGALDDSDALDLVWRESKLHAAEVATPAATEHEQLQIALRPAEMRRVLLTVTPAIDQTPLRAARWFEEASVDMWPLRPGVMQGRIDLKVNPEIVAREDAPGPPPQRQGR